MNSFYSDSDDLSFSADGSQLLQLSPIPASDSSHSNTGPGGDDLSLSDLSLDKTIRIQKPFSLLAKNTSVSPTATPTQPEHSGLADDEPDTKEEEVRGENAESVNRHAAKAREEKLQSDLFILKKLNASFAMFNEALDEAGSANSRVAVQLEQTDALLNKYVAMLSKSEEYARLIFDGQWGGAEADEEQIELERIEAEQNAIREARELALAAQRETERQEKEEKERLEREEKERTDREKREKAVSRGGVRGVRGTRASMRGMRAAAPSRAVVRAGSSTSSRLPPSVANASGSGIPLKRGTPPGTTHSSNSSRGLSRRT